MIGVRRLARGVVAVVSAASSGPPGVGVPASASGQSTQVTVQGPPGEPLVSAMPGFVVRTSGVDPLDRPLTLTLQISQRADFAGAPLFERSIQGDSGLVAPERPLPQGRTIFWRARAHTARGQDYFSSSTGPRTSATWLRLLSPSATLGGTLDSRRPTFRWSTAAVPSPPGPWSFVLSIEDLGTQQTLRFGPMFDSAFIPPVDLEINTSYRWSVMAALPTGDTTTVRSASSFVIADLNSPAITLLYQNFPNPFPTVSSATTCIWFDLHRPSRVRLTIHDIRGSLVKTIVPSGFATDALLAGRYGRGTPGTTQGCDPLYRWDGRGDDGRNVPAGVYLLRLKTESYEAFKKILLRGR